jgi:soluble lytic murein transglycosylase
MNFLFRLVALSTLATPALIALSCSHLSTQDRKDVLSTKEQSLLFSYQKAKEIEKSDPTGSCSLLSRLSKEKFPLQNLSLIRAHLVCSDAKGLDQVPENLLEQEPWLANMELDRRIFEAQRDKDFKALMAAQFKKAQKLDRIFEKIQWLQTSLETYKLIPNPAPEDQALQTEIQNRLYKLAPRLMPEVTPKDYFIVGMDFIFQRQFTKGRSYLEKIISDKDFSNEELYQARRAFRNSFKIEQKKDEYVEECGRFAHWTQSHVSPSRMHEAYVTWARAQWTEGGVQAARKILDEAEKNLKKKKYALDEVNFLRGRMAEEGRNLDEALAWLEKAEKESRQGSTVRGRILFSQAWILRKKSQFKEAAEAFAKLKNETQDPFDRNRYSFWLARSLKQSEKPEEATKELQELTQNDPLGYYGLVAYRELNADIPALQAERKPAEEETRPSSIDPKDHALIRDLIFVDESEILGKFLDSKALELRNQQNQNQEVWLYFLKSYAQAGLYNPLFQQVGALPVELKAKLLAQNPELLFPRKFLDLIQTWATKFGVKPELMLSIIRQESAFNPHARSGADALGLMQLLPSVAKAHEAKTGIHLENFEDLYKPENNIPFGASLLADLGKKYRGQFVLTAAAYNANEKAIESWLKTRLQDDPLEFIEDIPYEETKAYVKLVLRNFIFYSRLANPGQKLAFPNWCLEDLQSFRVSTL